MLSTKVFVKLLFLYKTEDNNMRPGQLANPF